MYEEDCITFSHLQRLGQPLLWHRTRIANCSMCSCSGEPPALRLQAVGLGLLRGTCNPGIWSHALQLPSSHLLLGQSAQSDIYPSLVSLLSHMDCMNVCSLINWMFLPKSSLSSVRRRLVDQGLFQYSRNPMYLGVFALLFGEALIFNSRHLLYFFLLFLAAQLVNVPLNEERWLRRGFAAEYEEYCKHVPRWLPRMQPHKPAPRPKEA